MENRRRSDVITAEALLPRVERLEEKVKRIENQVNALVGIQETLDAAVVFLNGVTKGQDEIRRRLTILDGRMYGLLKLIDPNGTIGPMDPPIIDDLKPVDGGTA